MARSIDKRSGKGIKAALHEGANGSAGVPTRPRETFDFDAWNSRENSNKFVTRQDLRRFWVIMQAVRREHRWHRRLRRWWLASWYAWTHPAPAPAPDIAPSSSEGNTP